MDSYIKVIFFILSLHFFSHVLHCLFISSCTSTFNKLAIFTRVTKSGCATLEHHLETVDGFLPNCPANHLPVFFFSTRTNLSLFISSIKSQY